MALTTNNAIFKQEKKEEKNGNVAESRYYVYFLNEKTNLVGIEISGNKMKEVN